AARRRADRRVGQRRRPRGAGAVPPAARQRPDGDHGDPLGRGRVRRRSPGAAAGRPGRGRLIGVTLLRTWLRLELRRRWRSLAVLALLVAISTGVVLTSLAGARRGANALDRLRARTLPATVAVYANQPGFDWNQVRTLPDVSALGTFVVTYAMAVQGLSGDPVGFPPADDAVMRTIERPVVLS